MTVYPSNFLCGECGEHIDVAPANLFDRETGKLKRPVIAWCINQSCSTYPKSFEVEPIEVKQMVYESSSESA